MSRHTDFEWDPDKADSNLRKHGVSFEDAAEALADPFGDQYHLDDPQDIGREERWKTMASFPHNRNVVLVIAWTERTEGDRNITRIISARHAKRLERNDYEQQIYKP